MKDNFKNLWVKDKKESYAQRWVKYWQPPARPVPQEIDFLRNFIPKLQKKQKVLDVMILGSTSEYRDLMFELGIKPTIVDLSKENYKILSEKMEHRDSYENNETFVEQKWQEINVGKKFDIVLGHFALTVNPFEIWEQIFDAIQSHLKKGGLFITNNWITGDEAVTVDDIIREYDEKWQKEYTFFGAMMPKIYIAARDEKDGKTTFAAVAEMIDAIYDDGKISEKNYQDFENLGYRHFNSSLFISSEEKFRQGVEKYFIIKDKVILDPYPNAYLMPEWILEKK
jgi:hypothetical protein